MAEMVESAPPLPADPAPTAQAVAAHLKRHGPSTVGQLRVALQLSENAVRHHLQTLERHGLLRREGLTGHTGGRPATRYALTARA